MTGIKKILAATDFSRWAASAVRRAAQLADTAGAHLELMHVLPTESIIPATWKAVLGGLESDLDRMRDDMRDRLRRATDQIEAEHALPIETHLGEGRAHAEIVARAEVIEADLVVVGARGEHFVLDVFTGTTAQRVQRHSSVPVLMVRLAPFCRYEQVLLATDFSPASANAAQTALRFFPDARFHVLHVFDTPFESSLGLYGADRENYRRQFRDQARLDLATFVREAGIKGDIASVEVRHGYPPTRIKEWGAELDADVVVLGTQGKSWLEIGYLGRVSELVAAESVSDVLLVRPPG